MKPISRRELYKMVIHNAITKQKIEMLIEKKKQIYIELYENGVFENLGEDERIKQINYNIQELKQDKYGDFCCKYITDFFNHLYE